MELTTIRIPKRRYDALVSAVAALLEEYDVAGPPSDDFDVETLEGAGEFERFHVVRDFAVRLGRADPVEGDGDDELELEVHAHHLVALVAAFPDLTGAADVPEPDLSVAVQGLCHAYLAAFSGAGKGESDDGGAGEDRA